MKKVLIVSVILMLVFLVSCGKSDYNIATTQNITSQHSGPQVIFTSFSVLNEIRNILGKAPSDEFEHYMEENYENLSMNGMYDYNNTEKLVSELESTYVLLFDDGLIRDNEISFYHERNEIHISSYLSEDKRIMCYAFTPESETNNDRDLDKNEDLLFETEIIKDGAVARIYSSSYENRGYHAEIRVDGTYIFVWMNQKQTLEEFEADFEKLRLVKISELLDEISTVSTESDANSIHG